MDNTREKLIELLNIAQDYGTKNTHEQTSITIECKDNETVADHLIASGVTIQKWIPVTERLPKRITNKVITLSKNGYVGFGHYENYKGRKEWYNLESDMPFTDWNDWRSDEDDSDSYEVTHWMPLPEPPKED